MRDFFVDLIGEKYTDMLIKFLPNLLLILVAYFVIKFVMKFVNRLIKRSKLPKNIHSYLSSTIKFILYFIVILIVCSHLGINVTSLVAAFSIVGVAFSLSLQSSLSNVMSGITMLFTKQFNVDDFIEAGGVSGTVVSIGISHCKLRTPDNKEIYVPNSTIISEKIINYSTEPYRRLDISIGASYSEDIDKVKNALQTVVDDTPGIIKEQPIFIGITAYKDSYIEYTIRVFVNNAQYWDIYFPMLEKVKRVFDENNIEIPFNQLDVHMAK